jgi:serine/threonine protein kinase
MEVVSNVPVNILRKIGVGEGRNSTVYLAEDPHLGGEVVLKEVAVPAGARVEDFLAEAQHLYHAKHPNVVPVNYAAVDAGCVRIVMPYFRRGSIARFSRGRAVRLTESLAAMRDVLAALHHVHARRLVHLDVKPSNILLADSGSSMLSDFGQSRLVNALGVAAAPKMYVPIWPPELVTATHLTPQADVYQAGIALWRLLHGELAWRLLLCRWPSLVDAIADGRLIGDGDFSPHVPRALRRVIRKATSKDPARRYGTAHDMKNALANVSIDRDWRLVRFNTTHACWEYHTDAHTHRVYCKKNRRRWDVEYLMVRLADGKLRRRPKFEAVGLTRSEARSHLNAFM